MLPDEPKKDFYYQWRVMSVKVSIKNIKGEYKPLNIFQYFDDGIRKRLPKGIANEFKGELLKNIETNRFGFQLSKDWEDYKRSIGADTRPFIMFDHYKRAIVVLTSEGHLSVGFKKTSMHPRAGMSMGRLAVRLEYGDLARGLPARPLWRYTANAFFKERKDKIGSLIKQSIVK